MDPSKQLELTLKTLAATIVLGLLGNLLLGTAPWGVGFALYAFAVAGAGAYLYRHRTLPFDKGAQWLVPPILLFASLFAWRDATALKFLNGVALFALVGALALRVRYGDVTVATVFDYPFRFIERWIAFTGDFVGLATLENRWKDAMRDRGVGIVMPVLRGLLIAAPLLLVFGALLASADEAFNRLMANALTFDLDSLMANVWTIVACTWLTGGFLRRLFLAADPEVIGPARPGPKLSPIEVGVVLGALNLLFMTFISIQFRYLFGGGQLVHETTGLSYADYARRGFFELVSVVGLALPILLGAHNLLNAHGRAFRGMASLMVALLFLIMVSAGYRMSLYVGAFGISQLRIYVFAIMGWLALTLAWFANTMLRDRPERFAFGALVTGLLTIFVLNVANPDAIVARVNAGRLDQPVDVEYLGTLSADATPALVEALPRLNPSNQAVLRKRLEGLRNEIEHGSWRSLNLSQLAALDSLNGLEP